MRPTDATGTAVALCSETGARGCGHLVEFYDTERYLVRTVNGFLAPGLRDGGAAIVVATPMHRRRFDAALRAAGVDVDAAVADGRLTLLDAAGLLTRFMVDGSPDRARIEAVVGPLVDAACAGGRGLRVYGEMVALLWEVGDVASALRLEEHWNELAAGQRFALLCAYPTSLFDRLTDADAVAAICDRHTAVVPGEDGAIAQREAHRRELDRLRHELDGLRAELERVRGERQSLSELAFLDPLTGLANRRAFELYLEQEWAPAAADGRDAFVLVADLDGFKRFNDRHGHAHGDEALKAFAGALSAAAGAGDMVARIGGDEFAILLASADRDAPWAFERRLREYFVAHMASLAGPLDVSVGQACLRAAPTAARALAEADHAMYRRKRAHRPNAAWSQ